MLSNYCGRFEVDPSGLSSSENSFLFAGRQTIWMFFATLNRLNYIKNKPYYLQLTLNTETTWSCYMMQQYIVIMATICLLCDDALAPGWPNSV